MTPVLRLRRALSAVLRALARAEECGSGCVPPSTAIDACHLGELTKAIAEGHMALRETTKVEEN